MEIVPRHLPKTKRRSVDTPNTDIIPYHGGKRHGPQPIDIEMKEMVETSDYKKAFIHIDIAYCLAKQFADVIPGWTGFNTRLCSKNIPPQSKIGYLPIIDASPTQMSTVNTILIRSIDIAESLNLDTIVR